MLTDVSLVKKSPPPPPPPFVELNGFLPCSQQPATGRYPDLDGYRPSISVFFVAKLEFFVLCLVAQVHLIRVHALVECFHEFSYTHWVCAVAANVRTCGTVLDSLDAANSVFQYVARNWTVCLQLGRASETQLCCRGTRGRHAQMQVRSRRAREVVCCGVLMCECWTQRNVLECLCAKVGSVFRSLSSDMEVNGPACLHPFFSFLCIKQRFRQQIAFFVSLLTRR
jgi:hypothetical protein